jgi:hypothetical protein
MNLPAFIGQFEVQCRPRDNEWVFQEAGCVGLILTIGDGPARLCELTY